MASSSAIELKQTVGAQQSKATSFDDLRAKAAEHAFNELCKAHATCCENFKKFWRHTNIDGMVQVLNLTASIVPFENHELLKARDGLLEVIGHTHKVYVPREPLTEATPHFFRQPTEQGNAKPSASDISHALCSWARYDDARHRIHGLTLDAKGRLSQSALSKAISGAQAPRLGAIIKSATNKGRRPEGVTQSAFAVIQRGPGIACSAASNRRLQQAPARSAHMRGVGILSTHSTYEACADVG